MELTAGVGETHLRKLDLLPPSLGDSNAFFTLTLPQPMISGVFPSTKVEVYSFTGNYFIHSF